MKQCFVKYLPVEGEIEEGDKWFDKNHNVIEARGPETGKKILIALANANNRKKAKLFLCSRDIKVGDKYWSEITNSYHICENEDDMEMLNSINDRYNKEAEKRYKVIGEISPKATWVKEGDEFDEIRYECLSINAFGEGTTHIFTEEEFKKRDIMPYPRTNSLCAPRGIWFLYIMVKGPCGHFH